MRFGKSTGKGQLAPLNEENQAYPELGHVQRDVFVVRVENNSTDARVTPRAMNQKELPKESELSNCHICGSGGLKTFNTADTNTDMGGLNHGYIVGTVTDGQQ